MYRSAIIIDGVAYAQRRWIEKLYVGQLHLPEQPYSWLYKTARRRILLEVKRGKRVTNFESLNNDPSFEDEHSRKFEANHDLIRILSLLSEKDQQYLRLRYIEELSFEEIATFLNKTRKQVYDGVERALVKAKKITQERPSKKF